MLIALLVVLGINLVFVVFLLVAVLARRRWVTHQAGVFAGIASVVAGEVHGLGARPRRGYGHWVREVLVWTPAPLFLSHAVAAVDRTGGSRKPATKVRRLGDNPRVITLISGTTRIEVTVSAGDEELAYAPADRERTASAEKGRVG